MKHPHPMLMAAQVGDIEVFKWLRNNGMKWHPLTYTVARNSFHDDIAEWALKNGCPKDEHSRGKFSYTKANRLELTKWDKVEETLQEEEETLHEEEETLHEEEETLHEEEENDEEEQEDEEEEVMVVEDAEDAEDEEDVF
jgi:hypothetical protein